MASNSNETEVVVESPQPAPKPAPKPDPPRKPVAARPVRRHRKILHDNILGIRKPQILRMARRAGVKRVTTPVYERCRELIKKFLEEVLHDAIAYSDYSRRKTLAPKDVLKALQRQNRTLYGF
jgi:histone H4